MATNLPASACRFCNLVCCLLSSSGVVHDGILDRVAGVGVDFDLWRFNTRENGRANVNPRDHMRRNRRDTAGRRPTNNLGLRDRDREGSTEAF